MRALVATGLLALALSGCDYFSPPAQHTAAAVTPPCNCITQSKTQASEHAARAEEHAMHRDHHHYRSYAYGRSSHSYREYATAQMAQYEYSSSSSVSDDQGDYYRHYEDQADDYRAHSHHEGWTDGYGRTHYGSATHVAANDENRLDPWHDYDKHCPDRDGDE